jgi:hypothetical protein
VGIERIREERKILSGTAEIRATEVPHLKPKSREEGHREAIGAGFVTKAEEEENQEAIGAGFVTKSKPKEMEESEAVSKTQGSNDEDATEDTEEEQEEELIQLIHHGEVHNVPYSQVRSFRTRFPSAAFLNPLQRNPQKIQLTLPYTRASPAFAGSAGSNPATGRTNDSGENVPRTEDSSSNEETTTDICTNLEEEEEDEWANYWPPIPPSSDEEDDQSDQSDEEEESRNLDTDSARQDTAIRRTLEAIEVEGDAHENITPDRSNPPVDAGFKSLQVLYRADETADLDEVFDVQKQQIQVVIRFGKSTGTLEVSGEDDLWKNLEEKWSIGKGLYRLSPGFDEQKSGAGYSIVRKVQGGKIDPMQSLRPQFGYWYREDRGRKYCRFRYKDRVCDAYLKNWITDELVLRIQIEHPDAGPDLRVWRKGAEVTGPFEWDDISLCVAERPPKEDEYPDLWRWEVEIDTLGQTEPMRISPIHPLADMLGGVESLWRCERFCECVAWGPLGPLVEAECRDGMIVRIRERGEGLEEPEYKTLVHCEGQELEIPARTWSQLRYRLNDVARTRAGLRGFHVSGEQDRTGFANGEELWVYWTDGLLHWGQWESLIPDPSQKTVVIIIEDEINK